MRVSVLERAVRALALIVPPQDRPRWREEWLAEIEHAAGTRGWQAALRIAAGAPGDALAFRNLSIAHRKRRPATERGRGFMIANASWLDFKLGARMLLKYPGVTAVGVLAMSLAIAIGALSFTFFYSFMHPTLPLDEGDRIVGIENWDAAASKREERTLHDFVTWRGELKSIEDVGAFRMLRRNFVTADGRAEAVSVAEMTASGFTLARVAPLLGRPLVRDDERTGAPEVVVIGADVWRMRFASSPNVVGQTVRIGNTVHTIVGVMPEGFAFPVTHNAWIPLRANLLDYDRRTGFAMHVFGRLAPGVTHDTAQAELTTIGLRAAAQFPQTNEHLRPRLIPYSALWFGDDMVVWHLHVMQLVVTLLLVVVCVNVASLTYARTATRHGEIAVRTALGGSRLRIVMQLFVEALVLSAVAAAVGLVVADRALLYLMGLLENLGGIPFWFQRGLSSGAVLYVGGFAILGAAVVGVVPALKATGRRIEPGLRQLTGASALRLGGTWTTMIVAQVALAIAVMPAAIGLGYQSLRLESFEAGALGDEILTARFTMDYEPPPTAKAEAYRAAFDRRFASRMDDVVGRLANESRVASVAFASRVPGDDSASAIEIEGMTAAAGKARSLDVGINFFDAFQFPVVAGRGFDWRDLDIALDRERSEAGRPVIVNRAFAEQVFGHGNAIGQRIRSAGVSGARARWQEIVGVVADASSNVEPRNAWMYHPIAAKDIYPVTLFIRVRGTPPETFATRLREIATDLDTTMQVAAIRPMDEVRRQEHRVIQLGALGFGLVALSVLLLSSAGVYAVMSLAVSQRQREIGIRAALGANPRRILAGIFARALRQIVMGVIVGLVLAVGLLGVLEADLIATPRAILLPAVAFIMLGVGLLAAWGPARRGLRIDPTEALRADT